MADICFDNDDTSGLLCNESNDMCFDELDDATGGPEAGDQNSSPHLTDPMMIRVPVITEENFALMLGRERQYLPKRDYLWRLRSGQLNINFRTEASDWISKAHAHYCFGPLSFCLAMNYLDRFLSIYDLTTDTAWAVQLLAVACLSIAVKMEETYVPHAIQLQVAEPTFVFEAKTIQRMELLVLSTLRWHMSALTPCSFVDYFLSKITDDNPTPTSMINRSIQLILATVTEVHFLEFKPSEVAAAVAVSVAGEVQRVSIDRVISSSSSSYIHVQKVRVLNCVELIKELSPMDRSGGGGVGSSLPESPNGVLEAECFSNTREDITAVSH